MLSELNMVGNWYKDEPESGWHFDEIKFDEEVKHAFEELDLDIQLQDYSARINISSTNNHTYVPSHYFLYALKLQPLVTLVNQYIDVFDLLRRSSNPENIATLINSTSPTNTITDGLDPYSKNNFFDVFKDKNKRLRGKDIINGSGAKTSLRDNDDFVRSIILKALPVPDASSDILGKIIYCLSQSPLAFKVLENKYSAYIPYFFIAESGDQLLFKVISTLGWQKKLDSLLDGTSTRTIDWEGVKDVFLVNSTRVTGNTNYLDKPVHYSKSLNKYVFIKAGLLNTAHSLKEISSLVTGLWPNMIIHQDNDMFFFKSIGCDITKGDNFEGASNKIFYGAPGTGKSHKVLTVECKGAEKFVTVFHPDTQYSDFIGSLKPKMEKDSNDDVVITYQFRPGPFTSALIKAIKHQDKHVCLVIEEINRAPASAVFGEVFQLLDRKENGESTYKVNASDPDMLMYINEQLRCAGCVELSQLEIPANLSLLATMNSSDQAVMPLDTAFKRRWSFEYLDMDFSNPDVPQTDIFIKTDNGEFKIKWPELAVIINGVLVDIGVAEDRLIGPFFLNKKELESSNTAKAALKGKLFVYLWDDVLRHLGHQKLFAQSYKTFGELSNAFNNDKSIFNSAIQEKIEVKGKKVELVEALADESE